MPPSSLTTSCSDGNTATWCGDGDAATSCGDDCTATWCGDGDTATWCSDECTRTLCGDDCTATFGARASAMTAAQWPPSADLVLAGEVVTVRKYRSSDAPELVQALADPQIWEHIPAFPQTVEDWDAYVLKGVPTGRWPFVVRLTQPLAGFDAGAVVGSSSYYDVSPDNSYVSIGYTTYTPQAWGTAVNPATKLLLLQHAFEVLGMNRVQLKTDNRNLRSQAAMVKIGATREGVLREHMVRRDGTRRDSVIFSILASEWPAVRQTLQRLITSRSS